MAQHLENTLSPNPARPVAEDPDLARARESLALQRRTMEALERVLRVDAAMSEEVFRLFDELQLSERRAQAEARLANQKEERIRQQLPFRLGTTLLNGLRRPMRWLRLPIDLLRTVQAYKADKTRGLLAAPLPAPDALHFRKDRLALVVKAHWQRVVVQELPRPADLWLTPLCVDAQRPAILSVRPDADSAGATLLRLPGAKASASEPGTVDLQLSPGVPIKLLEHSCIQTGLRLRGPGGAACILKLELRRDARREVPVPASPTAISRVAGTGVDPRPVANAILWQACQLDASGQADRAIDFATRHARAFIRPAINLLRANRAIGDDGPWLHHLNKYVEQFGIAPIELRDGAEPLMSRLHASANPSVERGPLVSVIMPAHQSQETVDFAVRSILAQTWRPLELIVVDDASTDQTWEKLKALAADDPRIKLLRNAVNVGPYVSKNLALAVATGTYITGHDADDWAHPQRLERHLAEVLGSAGRIKASMTRMLRLDAQGRFVHFAKEGKASDDGALRDAAISCLFEATALRNCLGHWDTVRFGADSELIARAQIVWGSGFVKLRQLAMLCLDADASLTNDPVHGVSKLHGVSPTRAYYREQWTRWHRALDPVNTRLPFPHTPRRFSVPDAAVVPDDMIEQVRLSHARAISGT